MLVNGVCCLGALGRIIWPITLASVVVQLSWSGTRQGELMGPQGTIKATGKRVENLEACQVVTVQGGKIKETRHYFDLMTLLGQIGTVQT